MTEIEDCIRSALRGEAVLVIGAGVGFLAKNTDNETVPSTSRLLELMFAELGEGYDKRAPLDRVSGHFGSIKGFPRLYEILKARMRVKGFTDPRYAELLQAKWKRIYTTNFDDAIEVACPKRKSHTIPSDLKAVGKGDIVHLNGFVGDIDPVRFDQTTNLTSWSYADSQFANSMLAHFFRTDLRAARHVVFLGISLGSDLDISRIISDDRIPRNKIAFLVGPETPQYDISTLKRYGSVFTEGVGALLEAFERLKGTPISDGDALPVSSFYSFTHAGDEASASRLTLRDQLLFGKIDLAHLIQADAGRLVGANQRLIGRGQVESITSAFREGRSDKAVIHGDIGSGKTFAAIEIARYVYEAGYDMFWARGNRFDDEEIQKVAQRETPTLLVFDGYIEHRDAIETAIGTRSKNTLILVCVRSVVYELSRESIGSLFGDDALVLAMRTLADSELESLDSMLLASGLLGGAAGGSSNARVGRYKHALGSSVFRILVDLVQSDHVREQIETEIAPILNDQSVRTAFAAILIGAVLETEFDIDQWDECVGFQAVDKLRSKYERIVRQFLDSDGYAFISRPAVIGTELLREFFPPAAVTAGLIQIYKYALATPFSHGSRRLVEAVMRYSRIERLFKDEGKFKSLMSYYDRMQEFQQTDENSQYWLQKAIAASIHGNLAMPDVLRQTQNFFSTAYARVGASQSRHRLNIDNYYARFMLMHALNLEDASAAFTMTNDAIVRLMRQIHLDEAKHYPFKAGRTLGDIVIKFAPKWNAEFKAKMSLAITRLSGQADKWLEDNGHNRDVESMIADCKLALPLLAAK